ncbi:unnamed protein product [Protopolystoma xenopodis]|uniref:Uncharacterized protein n=1 Tax=Protopolystoma xenopodis TaxID=117903 RepID=A0A3S5ANT9_9PLAT|nr:unnamed protein product [Protopolystoma xenopodis]
MFNFGHSVCSELYRYQLSLNSCDSGLQTTVASSTAALGPLDIHSSGNSVSSPATAASAFVATISANIIAGGPQRSNPSPLYGGNVPGHSAASFHPEL